MKHLNLIMLIVVEKSMIPTCKAQKLLILNTINWGSEISDAIHNPLCVNAVCLVKGRTLGTLCPWKHLGFSATSSS